MKTESGVPPTVENDTQSVIILSLSALGDLILTLPLIGEVRRRYPAARLTFVCLRKATAALARELAVADAVVALPPNARRSPAALLGALRRVRALSADIVLQTFSSHGTFGNLIAGAVRAPVRCGFAEGRFQHLLTHRIPVNGSKHLTALNLDLLRRLGHWDVPEPAGRVFPNIESETGQFSAKTLQGNFGRYVAISIGSDPLLSFKRWPAEKWADLCSRLAAEGVQSVFVGAESERAGVDEVITLAGGRGANLAGRTSFAELAAVIQASRALVATDGMLLHLASAVRKTTVGIFGPTHPDIGGPWGAEHEKVWLGLPCSPCYGSTTVGRPSTCLTRECLQVLPVGMVHQSVRRALARDEAKSFPLRLAATEEKL